MHPEQKEQARRWFNTPLIFSVQEAKGLEYETVILFNMVSHARQAFDDICEGITTAALEDEAPRYARPRDKQDRSAEIYKFFTNALYVALTRATHNIYLVEQCVEHPLWSLLALSREAEDLSLQEETSSLDEWQKTAHLLEKQGKQEQADAIRNQILQQHPVPWHIIEPSEARQWTPQILTGTASKAIQLQALEYSLIYSSFPLFNALFRSDFKPALQPREKSLQLLEQKYFRTYTMNNPVAVLRDVERYGVDHRSSFNLTPLMVAARVGNVGLVQLLIDKGADLSLTSNDGLAAYHHVLSTSITSPRYAQQKSAQLYALLKPESLSLQVNERLIKLDDQHMATFLVTLMQSMFYTHLGNSLIHFEAFSATLLAKCVAHLPDDLLPERRKRQSYISSLLSQHEARSKNAYRKKLFLRLRHGQYILNPSLKLRQGEDWVPVYQQLSLEDMNADLQALLHGYPEWRGDYHETKLDYHERIGNIMAHWRGVINKASKNKGKSR